MRFVIGGLVQNKSEVVSLGPKSLWLVFRSKVIHGDNLIPFFAIFYFHGRIS